MQNSKVRKNPSKLQKITLLQNNQTYGIIVTCLAELFRKASVNQAIKFFAEKKGDRYAEL